MSLTAYPTLRLKLTMPQALKLQFLPAVPGSNAAAAAAAAEAAAAAAETAANNAVAATANKVDRTGDVMTGFLTLNADPTVLLHAATKQYVDAHVSGGVTLSASQLAGRGSASGTGAAEAITLGTNLTMSGTTLNATGSGGGAPVGAEYITSTPDATLSAERVLTDSATITWDRTVSGQIKANTAAGGGNVSNSGTPALDQVGLWVTATTIKGIGGTANQVLRVASAGTTPAFGAIDLSQSAAVTGALRAASFPTLTGDVTTAGGALATTIANDAVTYAKMQNVSAASVLIGRGSAAGAGDPQEITLGTNLAMSGTTLNATGGSATTDPIPPQGRLTLQTLTPVMTTTQAAKTTLFYTPYVGNKVPIYDGANMVMTTFAELSVATTDTTKNPAAIGASKVNDWFVWNDAGTVRLCHGPDWTSDTARSAGTGITAVNGIYINNAAITNACAAGRGTYVGTTRSNASSQLDFIFASSAANGGQGWVGVWNAYNRVTVKMQMNDSTASWTYGTAAWRAANNSPTARVSFVSGLQEDGWCGQHKGAAQNAAGGYCYKGVGYDSTTVLSGFSGTNQVPSNVTHAEGGYSTTSLGFHFVSAIEYMSGGSAGTFFGNTSSLLWSWLDFDWRC